MFIFLVAVLVVAVLMAFAASFKWRYGRPEHFPSGEISFVVFVLLALFSHRQIIVS